jgi:hypothetical protein
MADFLPFLWIVAGLSVSQRRGCDNWFNSIRSRALQATLHGVVFAILYLGPLARRYGHPGRHRL